MFMGNGKKDEFSTTAVYRAACDMCERNRMANFVTPFTPDQHYLGFTLDSTCFPMAVSNFCSKGDQLPPEETHHSPRLHLHRGERGPYIEVYIALMHCRFIPSFFVLLLHRVSMSAASGGRRCMLDIDSNYSFLLGHGSLQLDSNHTDHLTSAVLLVIDLTEVISLGGCRRKRWASRSRASATGVLRSTGRVSISTHPTTGPLTAGTRRCIRHTRDSAGKVRGVHVTRTA